MTTHVGKTQLQVVLHLHEAASSANVAFAVIAFSFRAQFVARNGGLVVTAFTEEKYHVPRL